MTIKRTLVPVLALSLLTLPGTAEAECYIVAHMDGTESESCWDFEDIHTDKPDHAAIWLGAAAETFGRDRLVAGLAWMLPETPRKDIARAVNLAITSFTGGDAQSLGLEVAAGEGFGYTGEDSGLENFLLNMGVSVLGRYVQHFSEEKPITSDRSDYMVSSVRENRTPSVASSTSGPELIFPKRFEDEFNLPKRPLYHNDKE